MPLDIREERRVPDPDGRPWWDKPPSVDYGGGTPEEQETQLVAKHAIDAAMASIGGVDTRKWADPTPKISGFLAPHIEKGFHEPETWMPGVLQDAYKAFSEMHTLLSQGTQPSDPEVVKRSFEVAGLLAGGGMVLEGGATVKAPIKAAGRAIEDRVSSLKEAGLSEQRPPPVPEPVKAPKAKNVPPKEIKRELDESGYYSQLRETIAGLQKSEAHPSEYMALLEPGRSGVKEGEIRATGLDKFLLGDEVGEMRRVIIDVKEDLSTLIKTEKDLQIKVSQTKNPHDLKVLEKDLAETKSQVEEGKELIKNGVNLYNDKMRALRGQPGSRTREELSKHVEENKTIIEEVRHQAGVTTERDAPGSAPSNIPPRVIGPEDLPHSSYTTDPSNPTMREVQLTIRNPEAEAKLYAVEKKIKELDKIIDKIVDAEIRDERLRNYSRRTLGEDYVGKKLTPDTEKVFADKERLQKEKADIQDRFYHTGGHFTSNTAAWYMASMQKGKDGRSVFVPHQVQSDWGQSIKARGSQSPEEIRKLEKAVKEAKDRIEDVENKGLWMVYEGGGRSANFQKALDIANKIKPIAALTDKETHGLQIAIIRSGQTGHWQEGVEQIMRAGRDDLINHGTATRLVRQIDASPAAEAILKSVQHDFEKTYAVNIAKENLRKHLNLPVHHPMVGSTSQWVDLAVKRIIKDAIDSGADSIAIPHGKTVQSYTGGTEEGQKKFYEGILPKRLEKALKDMDPSIEGQAVKDLLSHKGEILKYKLRNPSGREGGIPYPARYTEFPITDAIRAGLKKQKGSKLYTKGPVAPPQSEENE
jgi:hypothetical protein